MSQFSFNVCAGRLTTALAYLAFPTVFANLNDISMGGCHMEPSTFSAPAPKSKLNFSMDDSSLSAEGLVTRRDPGPGLALQFLGMNRKAGDRMFPIQRSARLPSVRAEDEVEVIASNEASAQAC